MNPHPRKASRSGWDIEGVPISSHFLHYSLLMRPAGADTETPAPVTRSPAEYTGRARLPRRPWRGRQIARKWRYRLAPDPLFRKPKGTLPFWAHARRLFWSWWPWALACLWNL